MQPVNDTCQYCNGNTYESEVKICLWEGEEAFIIEDVPARICEECYEQFYDEAATLRIETLRRDGFPRREAKRIMEVPVFSLSTIEKDKEADQEEKNKTHTDSGRLGAWNTTPDLEF